MEMVVDRVDYPTKSITGVTNFISLKTGVKNSLDY